MWLINTTDSEKFGFKKSNSIIDEAVSLVVTVVEGFESRNYTLCVFLDLIEENWTALAMKLCLSN